MAKRQYDTVDLFKFIFSILIVAHHCGALLDFGEEINQYVLTIPARLGVPFFFLASAFFLFSRSGTDGSLSRENLLHFIKRIGLLYVFWFCLSIPATLHNRAALDGYTVTAALKFVRDLLFASGFPNAWYLSSTIFCVLVIYLLQKKLSTRTLLLLFFPVYVFCISTSAYGGLWYHMGLGNVYELIWRILPRPHNTIFAGLFFFTLGKAVAEQKSKLEKIRTKVLTGLFIISFACMYAEIYFLDREHILRATDCFFLLIPAACFLFLLALRIPPRLKHARVLRNLSTMLYCSQGIAIFTMQKLQAYLEAAWGYLFQFALVISMCFGMAFLLLFLSKKKGFHWLQCSY